MTDQDSILPTSPLARLAQVIAKSQRFRGDTASLNKGEQAALARLDPDAPRPHQIGALAHALVLAGIEPDDWKTGTWHRWALLAQGMALAGHDGSSRLGAQFAHASVSESRVTRLLTARGDAFRQQVPRLARLMASRRIAPNWLEFGALILATDRDEAHAEALRLRIAGSYYAAAHR
ncbi:MAG: type I-E CRISPR-associated protein Cse2/CasB [Methyloversatilis sp.]|uniref:type I-E CRISPR-associated protein Cse2/CasB n=1 Tax=Methyloversatilis sp. TaxID=2569862 RepID=UPI0027334CB0|nr:type I-E CRISPR-associated protein Cse2/CasB [Methyloversatilis sp.]MDP3872860.1 type I-E CRISPR-associated protein Cse2/CasB [Methyloversatilis sp.]